MDYTSLLLVNEGKIAKLSSMNKGPNPVFRGGKREETVIPGRINEQVQLGEQVDSREN